MVSVRVQLHFAEVTHLKNCMLVLVVDHPTNQLAVRKKSTLNSS